MNILLIIVVNFFKPISTIWKPSPAWRPAHDDNKLLVDMAHGRKIDVGDSYYEHNNLEHRF
jgi:hypothetical protein